MNLNSLALKQFESANAICSESEKINWALCSLKNEAGNNCTSFAGTLKEVNKKTEDILSKIISERTFHLAEFNQLKC